MDDLEILNEAYSFLNSLYNKYEKDFQKYIINGKNKLWKYMPYIMIFQIIYLLGVSHFLPYSLIQIIGTFLIGMGIDFVAVKYFLSKDRLEACFNESKEIMAVDENIIKQMKELFNTLKICSDKGWIDSYELDKWIKNVEAIQNKKQISSEIWKEIFNLKEHILNILNEKQRIIKRELFLNNLEIKDTTQQKKINELNHKCNEAQINFKELL